ncbi:Potassium-transporting ATPase potassium-binding subunit [Usitatibacter rugosus]|uniref:Potassium-transporting ATPase potassium-binding subunit n=1 Tax=Usitatibacter rugosus TaxID=2732067 RepID=A0A6M4H0N9_9PROT|nr:potassium-transporting ATPase subunit KdpA [Usitatibacter rugosus]QJR12224.1 Potassium-transporting ATPase potassium-binding subunit [Usitatibacter rugosus]
MSGNGYLQLALYLVVLIALAKPLGLWMARVYSREPSWKGELLLYRAAGVDPKHEMKWTQYAIAMLIFNVVGLLAVYALQRFQASLPLNPAGLGAVSPDSAFNTAISFATNTNWQGYGGESTMSYLTQMLALTVQNFVSAASGMATLVAFIRGFTRKNASTLGNFWVDMTRSTLYILLPLAFVWAIALVSQGVPQTFSAYPTVPLVESVTYETPEKTTVVQKEQVIAVGPVASQVAIKQLGTNGGGFFNVNSAHPLENPTPLSNFFQVLAILLIPAALCYTFGVLVGDRRQGWAVMAAMTILFVAFLALCVGAEQSGNPMLAKQGADTAANMEGKEVRFGIVNSALWATATTAASNGSVNAMHDSFTPLGGLVPMWLIQFQEVIFGGAGSGLYGMLVFAIIGVFVAGLMIGRTPEYLGKKIESFEMKMAAITILVTPFVVLVGTAVAVLVDPGKAGIANPGAHGFSEILYAFSSAGNNNGSAFAGLSANTPFYNTALGFAMLFARYWLAIPTLAIAGALAAKKSVPPGLGTLPTHTPLFVVLLMATVVIVGALTFVPALALGPGVEHLMMVNPR